MNLSRQFRGKVAVVIGGGGGLGTALSRALVNCGAKVVIADLRKDAALRVAQAIDGEAAQVDVTDPDQIAALLHATKTKYGSLNLVINNAGIMVDGESLDVHWKDWQHVIQVNLMGVIAGSLAALKIMKQEGSGQILNIASLSGIALIPMQVPYSTSKA
jgi:NAD(P)-dependent dehydrogenase (short-subunit alcohol dehydrogenase family)